MDAKKSSQYAFKKFCDHYITINFKDSTFKEKVRVESAMISTYDHVQKEVEELNQQIKNRDVFIQQAAVTMDQANNMMLLAEKENKDLKEALQKIANQTDWEIILSLIHI